MAKILVIQHNDDDNLNDLAAPFLEAGLEVVQWHAEKTPAPVSNLDGFAGLVSLGAFAGVEEEDSVAWMPVERRLIEEALALEMPVLGLCFGSQLLASVAGAEVAKTGWAAVAAALSDYAAKAKDIGADIGQSLVGAFQSAEDAVGNFVKTGKFSFGDLVTSILADIAKLAVRKSILGPLANLLSGALGEIGRAHV